MLFRSIGYTRWRRNLAVGLGNALASPKITAEDKQLIRHALENAIVSADPLVAEHIDWALSGNTSTVSKD